MLGTDPFVSVLHRRRAERRWGRRKLFGFRCLGLGTQFPNSSCMMSWCVVGSRRATQKRASKLDPSLNALLCFFASRLQSSLSIPQVPNTIQASYISSKGGAVQLLTPKLLSRFFFGTRGVGRPSNAALCGLSNKQ